MHVQVSLKMELSATAGSMPYSAVGVNYQI